MSNNKFIAALKENKNDIRKKLAIGVGITVTAVAVGVILTKVVQQNSEVLVLVPDEVVDTIIDNAPTE